MHQRKKKSKKEKGTATGSSESNVEPIEVSSSGLMAIAIVIIMIFAIAFAAKAYVDYSSAQEHSNVVVLDESQPTKILAKPVTDASKRFSQLKALKSDQLKTIISRFDMEQLKEITSKISVVRLPDTQEIEQVAQYIINNIDSQWNLEEDVFEDQTPFGRKKFRNLIFTPKVFVQRSSGVREEVDQNQIGNFFDREVILSAHYDSKYFADFEFQGTTDSAVPCAMMLHAAQILKAELPQAFVFREEDLFRNTAGQLEAPSRKIPFFKMVFFDGEEAFVDWSPTDSTYGSRHLAKKYAETPSLLRSAEQDDSEAEVGAEQKTRVGTEQKTRVGTEQKTQLQTIETLILMDLMGNSSPQFYSLHKNTTWLYDALATLEKRVADLDKAEGGQLPTKFQTRRAFSLGLEDDHTPFIHRGVPVLHLIPIPFPSSWHTFQDKLDNVHWPTVRRLTLEVTAFLCQIFHVEL